MIHAQTGIDTVLVAPIAAAAVGTTAVRTATWDLVRVDGRSDYAEIRMSFGSESNTNATGPTIALTESDDLTTYNTFHAGFARAAEDLTSAKEVRYLIDCKSRKRYLKLTITPATTAASDAIQVTAIGTLYRNGVQPGSTTDMGDDVVVIG